jgi:hypothetical protein
MNSFEGLSEQELHRRVLDVLLEALQLLERRQALLERCGAFVHHLAQEASDSTKP